MLKSSITLFLLSFCSFTLFSTETVIIPKPKKIINAGKSFSLPKEIYLQGYYSDDYRINKEINNIFSRFNISVKQSRVTDDFNLFLGISGEPNSEKICKNLKLVCPGKAGGYVLKTEKGKIIIVGRDTAGLFYGLQSFKQLLKPNEKNIEVTSVTIEDYPSLKFRGIHFFTGKNAFDEQKNLIKIISTWKMNYVVLQMDYLMYDKHTELKYTPFAQSKEQIKELIKFANDNFIKVIPLLPTLGHVGYLFKANAHLDLAEDVSRKYCYNVTNPDTYKLIFDLFDELIDLFEPEYFHIGHDEFNELVTQSRRESSKKYSINELLEMDIDKIFSYFQGKNIKLILWGDMFLYSTEGTDACNAHSPEEAVMRRNMLKKVQEKYNIPEIVVSDWHYNSGSEDPKDFKSLEIWKKAGFQTVAATWSIPDNIRNFTRDAVLNNSLGMIQTTWAGYNFFLEDNINCHKQFSAYLLAADYSWSDRKEKYSELPYKPEFLFWSTWYKTMYNKLFYPLDIKDLPVKSVMNILGYCISEKFIDIKDESECADVQIKYEYNNPFSDEIKLNLSIISPIPKDESSFQIVIPALSSGNIVKNFSFEKKKLNPFTPITTEYLLTAGNIKIKNINKELYPEFKYHAVKFDKPVTVDCNIEKWKGINPYIFNDKLFIQVGGENWTSNDLNASVYFGYDENNIFMLFEIVDDVFHTNSKIDSLWNGDSIQIALDFLNDKMPEYNSDDLEIGVALVNGKAEVYSWVNYASKYYSKLNRIEAEVKNNGTKTVYEVKIPRDILGKQYKNSKEIGMVFVINDDDDGQGFKSGLASSKGLYYAKNPSKFSVLILD